MKRNTILAALTAVSLSAAVTPVGAQQLLPQPKQAVFGKGTFNPQKGVVLMEETSGAGHGKEYYRLHITPDTMRVAYADSTGLFYATQTISQLRKGDLLPVCDIEDWPSYEWRGCMIDISRHFFPLSFLKKQVDVLAHYKVNRLHLHLTDAGGWRMQIDRYPELTKKAAWRTESDWTKWWIDNDRRYMREGDPGAYGGYYTKDEMRELVAYAAKKGITVVPEIEMPGHSEELTAACPQLKCEGNQEAQGDVCPSSETTYAVLHNILDEVMEVFPSKWIHIGGDEAGKGSWGSCPNCQRKARLLGLRSTADLQGYLIQRIAAYLRLEGREAIGWDEVLDDSLAAHAPSLGENVNVMVWRDIKAAQRAMRRGHNVILSLGDYYLDRYQDAPPTEPFAGGSYQPLRNLWNFDPAPYSGDGFTGRVLGVQGNLWTEYIKTEDYAEYMLYPRELAIAEVGWSGRSRSYEELSAAVVAQYPWLAAQHVNAFDLRKEKGDRKEKQKPVRHLAVGAGVTYHQPYSQSYVGQGDGTLTDGMCGGWSYGDGRWQGFMQRRDTTVAPFDITIDLGEEKRFSTVSLDFMQSDGAWVFYPSRVTISISSDGDHFVPVYDQAYTRERLNVVGTRTVTYQGKKQKARFVRISAKEDNPGEWVFTDEVKVY